MPDNIYKDLAKMNCTKYLTTNYDNYLSDYVGKGPSDITHLYKEFINELDDPIYESMVYNLHGDYTKPSTIVLSRESYDSLYGDNMEFKKVLEHFRERYVLLFIGVSLDDEYIQKVLEVGSEKLRARHYILLADISPEQRIQMEKKYDIRILKYSANNGNHTTGIRKILNEIMYISDEIEERETNEQNLRNTGQGSYPNIQSMSGVKSESLPLMNEITSLPSKNSKVYDKVKEIKTLEKNGQINEAISEYNRILQESIFEPLSIEERKIVIKGMLYCYIVIRDYTSAATLIESALKLPKSKNDIDLLSCIIDYYFNSGDFELAYNIANEWYKIYPSNPLLYGLKVYTEIVYTKIPYERALNMLLNKDKQILIDTKDDNERQFIYRLAGEIALYHKKYDDAVQVLRKAYEIDDNIFNIEDLGLATYFKAIEKADNGITIRINEINLNGLNKAVEYFEAGFIRSKGSKRQGIYLRVAIPYLRSLFYLRRVLDFDQMYDQLVAYCEDDIYEIHRMKAINDTILNKINMEVINTLNDIDKALILSEAYNMRGMYEHAIEGLKPIVEKYFDTNEDVVIQFLAILFNAKEKQQFNEYYIKYITHWNESERIPIIQSFYYEVNEEYEKTEKVIQSIIDESPSVVNYNILISFYRRTGQIERIGDAYKMILMDKPELVNQDPDSFYFAYHEYLMKTNNIEKAYCLYSDRVKSLVGHEVLKFIEVDIKIALKDFSEVIENSLDIYDKYKDYGETIYAYYASVAYLHYNDFEKSRQYLNMYKANGHVDDRSVFLVKQVEDKLNVLQKRVKVNNNDNRNYIRDIAFRALSSLNIGFRIPQKEPIVIDAPALYALFYLGEKEKLKDNPKVFITFTTIEQLHNAYCYCGDELIFDIIEYIREAENIVITSPSMESMIYSRKNFSNQIQDFYDSLNLGIQKENPFVTAYRVPFALQQDGSLAVLPEGVNTIKVVNNEILIYTGNV